MATICAPLYRPLRKGSVFRWGSPQQAAFKKAKEVLSSASVLVHYDQEKALCVSCDASPYRVGAVLAHHTEDGSEQPIAFASRRLASAIENYSQLNKEALAVVFAVKKFHQYLYGRNFSIFTDHKPLVSLLSEWRLIPMMVSSRILWWSLTL